MTYTPDIRAYQQLRNGDPFGSVNCTAWCGAWIVDADTAGAKKTTGTRIRAATDEPVPDPKSPGLNLPQVDAAILRLEHIDFRTDLGRDFDAFVAEVVDGRWGILQVIRGPLVDAGYGGGSSFRGGHAITIHYVNGAPVVGDPLVPFYMRVTWGVLRRAAAGIAGAGKANMMVTRDLTADYTVTVRPSPPHHRKAFAVFTLSADGSHIVARHEESTGGFAASCTPPRFYPWPGHEGRTLVQLTDGSRKGEWVKAMYADRTPGSQP